MLVCVRHGLLDVHRRSFGTGVDRVASVATCLVVGITTTRLLEFRYALEGDSRHILSAVATIDCSGKTGPTTLQPGRVTRWARRSGWLWSLWSNSMKVNRPRPVRRRWQLRYIQTAIATRSFPAEGPGRVPCAVARRTMSSQNCRRRLRIYTSKLAVAADNLDELLAPELGSTVHWTTPRYVAMPIDCGFDRCACAHVCAPSSAGARTDPPRTSRRSGNGLDPVAITSARA